MRWLAIDTSGGSTVGLVQADTGPPHFIAQEHLADPRGHVEAVMPMVQRVLASASWTASDIDAVVVGTGPAPFTGLRVGIASATAFARATGSQIHGVCSLDAIAVHHGGPAVVLTDARRREVYWAGYCQHGATEPLRTGHEPAVGPVADALAWASEHAAALIGPAVGLYDLDGDAQARVQPDGLVRVAQQLLAAGEPTPLAPRYLRRPDIHTGGARKRAS
ncbi:MAG: tRNA (adenosine(37)-N6)-threonylcarbamoyltransferase complex dimerization subunit type 1 TsaB [Beutenbergiaceae bacterium]